MYDNDFFSVQLLVFVSRNIQLNILKILITIHTHLHINMQNTATY